MLFIICIFMYVCSLAQMCTVTSVILTVYTLLMTYYSRDDRLVTSLLISSQISDNKVDLPMNSSVELIFGNVSLEYISTYIHKCI